MSPQEVVVISVTNTKITAPKKAASKDEITVGSAPLLVQAAACISTSSSLMPALGGCLIQSTAMECSSVRQSSNLFYFQICHR